MYGRIFLLLVVVALVGNQVLFPIPSLTQVEQAKQSVICSQCGTINPATAKFCGKCGTKLEKPEAVSKVEPVVVEKKASEVGQPVGGEKQKPEVLPVAPAQPQLLLPLTKEELEQLIDRKVRLILYQEEQKKQAQAVEPKAQKKPSAGAKFLQIVGGCTLFILGLGLIAALVG